MGSTRRKVQSVLSATDFPGEILTGVPTIEVNGDSEAAIVNHRGILAYSREEICVGSLLGTVCLRGKDLVIFRMNRERVVIHGLVRCVTIGEDGAC
jgi:sporulation protein YqfC